MNFIAQVEEHLRDLGSEARKKHPGVKEASERAILQLRALQNQYVTAVRKATQSGNHTPHPTTSLFRSQDILRPFLLACNYPNASHKLLWISLDSFSLLIKGNAINPDDGIHMIRVWTIQANVCASNLCVRGTGNATKTSSAKSSSGGDGGGATGTVTTSSTSSSWFGSWTSSSTTGATKLTAPVPHASTSSSSSHYHSDVSSSSGAAGGSHSPKKESERIALELLSLLIQFLELREWPSKASARDELFAASVNLCCILLQINTANSKQSLVHQAAKSTLHQVLNLLVETSDADFTLATGNDLLHLSQKERTADGVEGDESHALSGAFQQCAMDAQHSSGPSPPSPAMCLELLHSILTTSTSSKGDGDSWKQQEQLLSKTTSVVETMLGTVDNKETALEVLWRSSQLACTLLTMEHPTLPGCEVEILLKTLIQGVVRGTEVCRNNHDFEDGFVYHAVRNRSPEKKKSVLHTTLIPDATLWRAALALETLHVLFSSTVSVQDANLVALVAETVSDFATIGASCREHMIQLLECTGRLSEHDEHESHTVFYKAEERAVVGSGSKPGLEIMGEALWTAFQTVLQLAKVQKGLPAFAPTLAMLQHYLKRFPGSSTLVNLTLGGYVNLARLSISNDALQRRALLASLCKLSLPSWGKQDSSCQLEDHHVETLVCLLKIIHKQYDDIKSEWQIVLSTFEELSTLSIASPQLSSEGYESALAISATYARFARLSTCLSNDSLVYFVDAMADTAGASLERRGILSDGERPLEPNRADASEHRRNPSTSEVGAPSIGGKLMSFAGRTLLGSQSADNGDGDETDVAVVSRTKNTYYGDYRKDFLGRLTSSKRAVRNDVLLKLPFSVIALTDVALANLYRYRNCGRNISAHLCSLAATSKDIRVYAMDTLALLITSQLLHEPAIPSPSVGPGRIMTELPSKNEYFVVEGVSSKRGAAGGQGNELMALSQVDLVGPLCDTLRDADRADLAETVVSALHSILEAVGHHLTGDVWTAIIESIASLSGDTSFGREGSTSRSGNDWSACSILAFRCVKLIVDDFLDQLPLASETPSEARNALLDCCFYFGAARHDVNTSLTAIGLLWSIADQDTNSWSIDRALSRLVLLAVDDRVEVRNCAINTLFSCVVGRGQEFTASQWEACICEIIFGVYDRVLSRGTLTEDELSGTSPRATSRYQVAVHHSRDSAGKQWATTEVLVLRGLTRVLRNFFDQILEGVDGTESGGKGHESAATWFEDAWSRIIGYASDAADQTGSRETLDIRSVGVELLVLCAQLSCRSGIHAAITPARVGTHMEVVNGALRSVRDSNSKTQERQTEAESRMDQLEYTREHLFLEAFDAVASFKFRLDGDETQESKSSPFVDTVQVQVLHSLVLGLGKLYDCCKNDELSPERGRRVQRRPSRIQVYLALETGIDVYTDDLEGRFVHLVASIARMAVSDPSARFLTQAQRAAFDLLRSMVVQSSDEALRVLASLGEDSFLWDLRKDGDQAAQGSPDGSSLSSELLRREAARVVAEEMSNESLSDDTKVQVLCRVLSVYVSETDNHGWTLEPSHGRDKSRKRCYKLLLPVMEAGLESAKRLEAVTLNDDAFDQEQEVDHGQLLDLLWEKVLSTLSQMVAPVQSSAHKSYIPRVASLLELLATTVPHVPQRLVGEFSDILSGAAVKSLEVSKVNRQGIVDSQDSEATRKLKKRHEEAQKVFGVCLSSLCTLEPQGTALELLVASALGDAISSADSSSHDSPVTENDPSIDIAIQVCKTIGQNENMDSLVVAVFPMLCKLVTVDLFELRREVGQLLSHVDIGGALQEATTARRQAEERARQLERQNEELLDMVDELREESESLQQQIAVYSTSSALT